MAIHRYILRPASEGDDLVVDGGAGTLIDAGAGNDTVFGRGGNDSLLGGDGNDRLDGNDGDDSLDGGTGNDVLYGNAGDDQLHGFDGDDVLLDDAGYAAMFAGAGNDVLRYDGERECWLNGGHGNDTLVGNAFADQIYAGDYSTAFTPTDAAADVNWLYGRGGNDSMYAGQGEDHFFGGDGADFVFFTQATTGVHVWLALATAQNGGDVLRDIENLIGSRYGDTLRGNAGANAINGSAGNDILQGGFGSDTLLGGTGGDRFVYALVGESPTGTARDIVGDFGHGDILDLSRIDANATLAGNQAFAFIGAQAFDAGDASGQVRVEAGGGYTTVLASVDADADAEFELRLTGIVDLTAADLAL